jgi:hypothetical protein
MVILENTKYSYESGLIYIQLKDTNTEISENFIDRVDMVKIKKSYSNSEETYTVTPTTYIDSTSNDTLLISIDIESDIAKDDVDYQDFEVSGIIEVDVTIDGETYISYIYNDNEFYSYKLDIYKSEMNDLNTKRMLRFLFLESAMLNAISLGYIEDATLFYLEMKKIYITFNPR